MIQIDRSQGLPYLDTDSERRYAAVSQALELLYGRVEDRVAPEVLEPARLKGDRRHRLFALLLLFHEGVAAMPKIDPGDEAFADAVMNWILKHDIRPLLVEEPAITDKYGYGGTPDAKVLLGPRRKVTIVDVKTGARDPRHLLQVQAYGHLQHYEDASGLMLLYVEDDGAISEYVVTPCPHAWAAFQNAVHILHWRETR